MAFGYKEASRHRGNPTKLFLFKGTDPTLESMMRSVTIIPGATEFGYGTTKVIGEIYGTLPSITNWNSPIIPPIPEVPDGEPVVMPDPVFFRADAGTPNAPSADHELIGRTTVTGSIVQIVAMDHVAQQGWTRSRVFFSWSAWSPIAYNAAIYYPVVASGIPENFYTDEISTDFTKSVDDLLAVAPNLNHVSLVAAWHGTDLRCGNCEIVPKVTTSIGFNFPYPWRVAEKIRPTAQVVSQVSGKPAYGGAPADRSLYEAIVALKAKGLKVTLYPFIMMDIAAGNALPNPYGGTGQPAYPWRGRITCHPAPGESGTVDATATASTQVDAFFGTATDDDFDWDATNLRVTYTGPDEWKFNRFILHMATIAKAAGADDFLLCGELVGLTTVRDNAFTYPAVSKMITTAAYSRAILGGDVKISYAADWSEYHSHQIGGDLRFPLDTLWANSNINYVGIDNYFPASDWRDGFLHADWLDGYTSIHDLAYLKSRIERGELYDWYYASDADRTDQVRTPITDAAHNEPWVFRQKDMRNWWSNAHHERIGGVRQPTATAWVPESKQIVFTEIGCAAIEKGPNQPNAFLDAKSSESTVPYFSNGRPDAAVMIAYLEANLEYWKPDGPNNDDMIDFDKISIWTWDARPYPVFPSKGELFGDADNWVTGHWLTGRVVAGRAFDHGTFGPYAFTNAEEPITRAGIVYSPWPIQHSEITTTGNLDKADITVTMATGSGLEDEFIGYPPSQVINLTIFQGHMDDAPSLVDYPAQWLGRVTAPEYNKNEVSFNCVPVASSIQRPGLRRNYQLGCPHVLYGPACQANKLNATVTRTVASITRNRVTLSAALGGSVVPANYGGGLLEWSSADGRRETRTIAKVSNDGLEVTVRGTLRGLIVGATLNAVLGCPRTMAACTTLHNNILNFGGQPFIPLDNPLSQKNQFY